LTCVAGLLEQELNALERPGVLVAGLLAQLD
jgi:hypothetical protein